MWFRSVPPTTGELLVVLVNLPASAMDIQTPVILNTATAWLGTFGFLNAE